jgi:Polyketide cyclase / dehydrase and lipid transport
VPSQEIHVTARTSAAPATVYGLLRDGASWPEWSPLGSFEIERAGEDEPEGVGAIRVFRTGRVTSREQIVELIPDRRLSYVLLSGLAIRNYRADVNLEPDADGTRIHWRSSFDPKLPGTGWLYRRQLTRFLDRTVDGLARRAQGDS